MEEEGGRSEIMNFFSIIFGMFIIAPFKYVFEGLTSRGKQAMGRMRGRTK